MRAAPNKGASIPVALAHYLTDLIDFA